MATLADVLDALTAPGELYEKLNDGRVRCLACGHRCRILEGFRGACQVRFNQGGMLRVPFGYVAGVQCDPIEKKPFFHVHPGALAYSFGMLGCNLHCGYCQNWVSSQALRDPNSMGSPSRAAPAALVEQACAEGAEIIVSTYNEPLITSEWSVAIFKEAKAAGLMTGYVSNGNATPAALDYLKPWLDLYKVDLKTINDRQYRKLGARLEPVLDSIRRIYASGIWLEIVTLLVPGFNDSVEELTQLTEFIAGVSPEIPWHVTAFHQDYKMMESRDTAPGDLLKAAEIGRKSGLRYIYAGNLPGQSGGWENTYCPGCGDLLVERRGFRVLSYRLTPEGQCAKCTRLIPGRWATSFRPQRAPFPFSLLR